ncbi:MAG: DNA translocase FtsK 4TM domain-containing protein [Syntrophales bacterium]|nr:DNA translocase FtsK 4TM domain-containing protein [Syntrophales bacterium]
MKEKQPALVKSREIKGVICLALALFLSLCLASYHPLDPSLTHYVAGDQQIHNLVGSVGSYTAASLFRLLGLAAFLLPIIFLIISFKYFLDSDFKVGAANITGLAALILSTSGLLVLVLTDIHLYGIRLHAGGLLGTVSAQVAHAYLNLAGAYILLILILIISLMATVNLSLVSLGRGTKRVASMVWRGGKEFIAFGIEKIKERQDTLQEEDRISLKTLPVMGETPLSRESRQKRAERSQFDFFRSVFKLPPLTLLDKVEHRDTRMKRDSLTMNSRILEKKLSDFGVEGKVVGVKAGPVITMYELEPAPGVKINKITNLSDDLALALRAPSIRIIAPVPGEAVIGIEIPNHQRESVYLKDVLDNEAFLTSESKLPIALGVDILGAPVIADLIRMPHLLIAGTTGSGKSVSLNAMICSILFKSPPDEVKFLMIDPKRLELSAYEGIPHLLHPVVFDPKKAALVLKWAVEEMERRYRIISEWGVKSIEGYNMVIGKELDAREKQVALGKGKTGPEDINNRPDVIVPEPADLFDDGKHPERDQQPPVKLPYIVIVIDELADLMIVAQRDVEESLARLAQMARAAGIHLILATQRPSVDVITGLIKANFPTRISFQVSSKVDSRTILDHLGAEKLLGAGDMLFIPPGTSKLTRIHGVYVSDRETERICEFVKKQGTPAYDESIMEYRPWSMEGEKSDELFDEKYDQAVELVTDLGQASISLVQRYMKIGYNRAARIIERMEAEGIVGPSDGVKPRKLLARKLPR